MHPHLMNLYIYSVVDACFPIQELDQNWDQNLAENKRHKTIFVSFLLIILRMRNAHNKIIKCSHVIITRGNIYINSVVFKGNTLVRYHFNELEN